MLAKIQTASFLCDQNQKYTLYLRDNRIRNSEVELLR